MSPRSSRSRPLALAVLLCGAPLFASSRYPQVSTIPAPPQTRRDDVKETLHEVEIVDPYRWLEDQSSPETRAFIDQQNAYAHGLLDALPSLPAIRTRLTALSRQDAQARIDARLPKD